MLLGSQRGVSAAWLSKRSQHGLAVKEESALLGCQRRVCRGQTGGRRRHGSDTLTKCAALICLPVQVRLAVLFCVLGCVPSSLGWALRPPGWALGPLGLAHRLPVPIIHAASPREGCLLGLSVPVVQ